MGTLGTVLVAGSNGMTVYTFTMDVKDSGESNCTGDCLVNWPALTVEAGETPSGGPGVTGALGTITRTDDSSIQVTYNGLPLYFFSATRRLATRTACTPIGRQSRPDKPMRPRWPAPL